MIQVLHVGSSSNDTNCWSMFGFLYGTFPAAPSSAIFAAKFGFEEELVSVICVISDKIFVIDVLFLILICGVYYHYL